MTFPLIRLELRKNRLAAASAGAAFLVTLPVCGLVSAATGLELELSLDAAMTGWVLAGVPLAAALIGASSGSAAGARDALDAEGLLPPSPARRAAAALAASALLTVLFAIFVLAVGRVLGAAPGRTMAPAQAAWGAPFWESIKVGPLFALAAFDVLAGAWALSRLIGHGVAGGLLALLLTAASGAAVAACFGLELLHQEWGAACYASALALASAGAFAKAWAGSLAARWSERRGGPRALALIIALLLLPAAAIWGRVGAEVRMLSAKVLPVEDDFRYARSGEEFPRGSGALAAAGEGAVLMTLRGGIVIADARGVRTVVPGQDGGLFEMLEPYKTWIRGAWRDEKGVLWIERYVSPNVELWRLEGETAGSARMTDAGSFAPLAGALLKHRYPGGSRLLVARAEDYFRRGDRAKWFEGYKDFLVLRRREAGMARVACAGGCLEASGRRWKLPGVTTNGAGVYPHEFAGRRAYLVAARNGSAWTTVICRADGTVDVAWPGVSRARGLPDGSIYSENFMLDGRLRGIDPDGTVSPPIVLPPGAVPRIMRRAEGKAWLLMDGRLIVLDAGGREILSHPMPGAIGAAIPLKDGFVIATPRRTYFSDWSGRLRPVENPR